MSRQRGSEELLGALRLGKHRQLTGLVRREGVRGVEDLHTTGWVVGPSLLLLGSIRGRVGRRGRGGGLARSGCFGGAVHRGGDGRRGIHLSGLAARERSVVPIFSLLQWQKITHNIIRMKLSQECIHIIAWYGDRTEPTRTMELKYL
jgi:hypothetical protein